MQFPVRVHTMTPTQALALAHPDRWRGEYLGLPSPELAPYRLIDLDDFTIPTNVGAYRVVETFRPTPDKPVVTFRASDYPILTMLGIRHELITANAGDIMTPGEFEGIEGAIVDDLSLGAFRVRMSPDMLDVQMHSLGMVLSPGAYEFPEEASPVYRTALVEGHGELWQANAVMSGNIAVGGVVGGPHYLARVDQVDILEYTGQ